MVILFFLFKAVTFLTVERLIVMITPQSVTNGALVGVIVM